MNVCMYVCMYVCICIHVCTDIHTYVYVGKYLCIKNVYILVHALYHYNYTVITYMYIYMQITHLYLYMHTYMHTHLPLSPLLVNDPNDCSCELFSLLTNYYLTIVHGLCFIVCLYMFHCMPIYVAIIALISICIYYKWMSRQ